MLHALPNILHSIVEFISQYKYVLLAIGSFIEGPILMITSGALLHGKTFSLIPLVAAFLIGDLFGDVLWYVLGRYGVGKTVHKIARFFGLSDIAFARVQKLFHKHKELVLFCSKITLGLGIGIGIMLAAGYSRIPFKNFIIINFVGGLVMVGSLMSLGYFFGDIIVNASSTARTIFGIITLAIVVALVVSFVRYVRKIASVEIAEIE